MSVSTLATRVLFVVAVVLYIGSLVIRLSGGKPLQALHGLGALVLIAVAFTVFGKGSS